MWFFYGNNGIFLGLPWYFGGGGTTVLFPVFNLPVVNDQFRHEEDQRPVNSTNSFKTSM